MPTEFEIKQKKQKMDPCCCPKCKGKDWEVISRRKVANQVVAKMKCNADGEEFECIEQDPNPCICSTCGNDENLEEIQKEEKPGGTITHYKCKKGHTARPKDTDGKTVPCNLSLPGCVVCCIDTPPPPGCACPECGASPGRGLVLLGTTYIPSGKTMTAVSHYKCEACGYVRGACSAGTYEKEEATECLKQVPPIPRCPTCGATGKDLETVSYEELPTEGIRRWKYKCKKCP